MTHTSLLLIWHTPPSRDEEFGDYEEYEDYYYFEQYEEHEDDKDCAIVQKWKCWQTCASAEFLHSQI